MNRTPNIRLSSDTVIPVTTHEGLPALLVSPHGVSSLAQQGWQVEVRTFVRENPLPAAQGAGPGAAPGQAAAQERRFGLTDFVSLFRRRLGQQLWLMCKLAFMVGVFSSNNASWRRIMVLCFAAAGIFCTSPFPTPLPNPVRIFCPPVHFIGLCVFGVLVRVVRGLMGSLADRRTRALGETVQKTCRPPS
jgi:hypothetical protein